ncbi:MAG: nitroreductase family protein, partial [Acidimicrobiales bacterium]|nr:nitroreductase family protein [Acidimicrobiales bacterium]
MGDVRTPREAALNPESHFAALMRRRRMTRAYLPDPIARPLLDQLLDTARRVPSAGNSQGFDFLVLDTPEAVELYWSTTFSPEGRERFRWQGLFQAPVLVVVYANADAYVSRYSEPDKARTGLGAGADAWSTPYWLVDASMAALALQLAALDAGLGVLFFGLFDHATAIAEAFGVPAGRQAVGTIAIGHPAPS